MENISQETIKQQITQSPETAAIVEQKNGIVEKANTFVLDNEEKLGTASQVISWIAGAKKTYESLRKKLVQPLNDHVKMINDMFKTEVSPLEQADQVMRGKMISYQQLKEKKVAEERARIEAEAKKLAKKEQVPIKEVLKSTELPQAETKVGNTVFKKYWTYEVVDLKKVPREYLVLDTTKVQKVVNAGIREIDGIRIFETDRIATR